MSTVVEMFTPEEVAAMFKLDGGAAYVRERCRKGEWPHMRLSERVIRFDADDVAEIKRLKRVTPKADVSVPATPEERFGRVARRNR